LNSSSTTASSSPIAEALSLAERALHISSPNPRVGCVITTAAGEVIGRGFTQQAGGPHAEIMALRDAQAHGRDVRGATVYVTLEPCSHHGRTGPCCDALIAAGVSRVVASIEDPNPLVAGQGFGKLRAAGIDVEVGPGAAESRELNMGFFSRMIRKRPWVRLKAAASLDGITALPDGRSQWITSAAAREDGQHWRARACAVLTGVGTVLADNPRLNVRLPATPRQPHLVIVDSRLETPPTAKLFDIARKVFIYAAASTRERRTALEARGATIIEMAAPSGKVDLRRMMEDLATREINEVHAEAGFKLNGSLLAGSCVDEMLLYVAPKLLGTGAGVANLPPIASLDRVPSMIWMETIALGPDLRLRLALSGRHDF
jgi:diaminohydroxyphosphoribosylaminopyrimidine deaminase/5-amino-6-(5-phosphoribosylamino)uracil reductase